VIIRQVGFMSPRIAVSLVALAALGGCQVVPQTGGSPAPEPTPPPQAAPPPAAAVPPPQTGEPWDVAPVAPGTWSYSAVGADSVATFANPASPPVTVRCLRAPRQIAISVPSYGNFRLVTIRTSAGAVQWEAVTQQTADGTSAFVITRPATDPGLDRIAYSRGRVSIEPVGGPRFILPVVAEIGRVIEDCRR